MTHVAEGIDAHRAPAVPRIIPVGVVAHAETCSALSRGERVARGRFHPGSGMSGGRLDCDRRQYRPARERLSMKFYQTVIPCYRVVMETRTAGMPAVHHPVVALRQGAHINFAEQGCSWIFK